MRPYLSAALTSLLLAAPAGCVQPFEGSHMQFALANVKTPCAMLIANGIVYDPDEKDPKKKQDKCKPGGTTLTELTQRTGPYHYEMWATVNETALVHLLSFTVQRHLFIADQKQMEKDKAQRWIGPGENDYKPLILGGQSGLYFDSGQSPAMSKDEQDIADKQMIKASSKYVISSFSDRIYVKGDEKKKTGKRLHPDFYVGSHTQLSLAHNGIYYGQVQASHPYGAVTLSGASVKVAPNLEDVDSIWITIEDSTKNKYDRASPKPNRDLVMLRGTATRTVRGIINVEASTTLPFKKGTEDARAEFGVMPSLGEEEYF